MTSGLGRVNLSIAFDRKRRANDGLAQNREPNGVTKRAGDRIFLAHAREDKAQVQKLYGELKARGFKPWFDKFDLIPGQIWETEIEKAIRHAAVFVACLSNRSVEKGGFVQKELRMALAAFGERPPGSIYLIPARLDDCEVPDVQIPAHGASLKAVHWVDLWEEDGLDRLAWALAVALGEAPVETGFVVQNMPDLRLSNPSDRESVDTLLSQPIGTTTLEAYTKWKYPDLPVDYRIQDMLLQQLHRERYKTLGDLNRVVDAASEAVKAYTIEAPQMFDAGTDYISKSLGFIDQDFRARHGFASITKAAFQRHSHLVLGISDRS